MNRATSGGCWSRTSAMKYPAIAWPRTSSARAARAGSGAPRSDSAAICSAAAHPSLLRCSTAQVPGADLHAEVGQQVTAFGQREVQVTVAQLAQFPGQPQPVQPQLRVDAAGQHQLRDLGRPAFHQVGHVPADRGRRGVEVVHDDGRPGGQPRGVVGDRRGDVGRHGAVHREQVGGVGAEPRVDGPRGLDEPGPEPDRVGVAPVARQPRRGAGRPAARPSRTAARFCPRPPTRPPRSAAGRPRPPAGRAAPAGRPACRAAWWAGTWPARTGRPAGRQARPPRRLPRHLSRRPPLRGTSALYSVVTQAHARPGGKGPKSVSGRKLPQVTLEGVMTWRPGAGQAGP